MTDTGRPAPSVSVILPVRHEGRSFASTLAAVLAQDYPDIVEVLVVDGMSQDGTRQVVAETAARDARVKLLDNPGLIVPCAMNVGILAARGAFIVRVDGHTIVSPDYVSRCVAAWRESGAACVGGRMDAVGTTAVGRLVALATGSSFGVGNSHFHYSTTPRFTDSVYLGAWPRAVLLEAGGFDEEMVRDQDDELNYRLGKRGGRIWLDPSIVSGYTPRGSLKKLWRQYFQYGFWKVRVLQKHASMLSARHFAPSLLVLLGVLAATFAVALPWGWTVLAAGVAAYAALGWIAAFRLPATLREKLVLPFVFFILHAAYGTGFLAGLVRFLPRWFVRDAGPGIGPEQGQEMLH
jgi:cellulose synthase/poly-beta-1,6-N-acetylglucosamine synthase-like glycosyltransferase